MGEITESNKHEKNLNLWVLHSITHYFYYYFMWDFVYLFNIFIKSPSKIPQHVTATDVRCISQATRVAGSAGVANDKCFVQATKAAVADKECISQSTSIASNGLISTEVLEMLEAMPDHDFFI